MRIALNTLGCKINQYETDEMRRGLLERGGTIVPFSEEADVYIINTCSVTAKSDYQCRQAIRAAARRGRGARVVVTGCYAGTRPDEIGKIEGVDLVVGNSEKGSIVERVAAFFPELRSSPEAEKGPVGPVDRVRTRGFLKVQDGCDNHCTYCIVPLARGRSRSVPPENAQEEFIRLVEEGCPEIVLSGIHIGRYGTDLGTGMDIVSLLKTLLAARGPARIRLSSIEPREISDELVLLLGKGLCRHLHIPLQSGNDSILNAMGRDYTSGSYLELLNSIAGRVPDIALGADVMVGFPGEGEAEFRHTVELIEKSPLTHLHVFSYSQRPGTPAAVMRGQVPEPIKKERNEILRALGGRKNREFRERFVGRRLQAVIEGGHDANNGSITGLTDNYIRVSVADANRDRIGENVDIRITSAEDSLTFSEVC